MLFGVAAAGFHNHAAATFVEVLLNANTLSVILFATQLDD